MTGGRRLPGEAADLRVVELAAAFWRHAERHYSAGHGGEPKSFRLLLKIVKRLYADARVTEFGPLQLRTARDAMVREGWSRKYINRQVVRLRHIFRWGVGEGLVPATIWHALQAVAGLKAGRTDATETDPVRPAPEHLVEGAKALLPPVVRSMVELQLLTGMRPGEVCALRTCDVDTTGRLWVYRPERHKTQHHGHERTVYIGPRAQEVLSHHLRPELTACVFRPVDSDAWHREQRAAARKTPITSGNRPGTNVRTKPGRKPGERFEVNAYRRAIERACDEAFPPPPELVRQRVPGGRGVKDARWERAAEWRKRLGEAGWARLTTWRDAHRFHPNQLRHNAATFLRKTYGIEAAQVILGHRTLSVTEIYAEKNVAAAQRIMAEVG